MRNKIVLQVLRPVLERLGTAIAAYLIASGADTELVGQAANGLVALLFVISDLIVAKWFRKAEAAGLLSPEAD